VLNAVDFGDLLLEVIRLFRENAGVLAEYQRKFKFILVDEYQDTNVAQYLWLRLLAQRQEGRPQNICCVGDDDQSIYGWRGAEVDNILRFDKDFPGATVIRLERNYRSTGHILAAAAHLIAHNEGRLGKTLFTDGEDGAKPTLTSVWDSEEEARSIGEELEQLQRQGHLLNEAAILVRASFQMREFEDRFITIGLPYRVIGGPRFYERLEIRDALAYLRCVAQASDDLAFERIVNTPKRGLGDATLQQLHDHARAQGVPLMQAPEGADRDRGDEAEGAAGAEGPHRPISTAGPARSRPCRMPSSPSSCSTRAATRRCGRRTRRPRAPGASKTSRSWCAPWRSSRTSRASSNISPSSPRRAARGRRRTPSRS
jgi:DNA helicase-2/ATP-dependent DNA helicase PcrA